jgi:hypothetical protein
MSDSHVHNEWTQEHRGCTRIGWRCTRCGQDMGGMPHSCVRCMYTVLAPLWRVPDATARTD